MVSAKKSSPFPRAYTLGCQVAQNAIGSADLKNISGIGVVSKSEYMSCMGLGFIGYQQPWENFNNHSLTEDELKDYKETISRASKESVDAMVGELARPTSRYVVPGMGTETFRQRFAEALKMAR